MSTASLRPLPRIVSEPLLSGRRDACSDRYQINRSRALASSGDPRCVLVGTPFLGCVAVDRPSHLFGASPCADRPARSCRTRGTLGLEFEPAIVEKHGARTSGLGVVHHMLVDDAVNSPGKHGDRYDPSSVHNRHKSGRGARGRKSKLWPCAETEMLAEVGKAAGQEDGGAQSMILALGRIRLDERRTNIQLLRKLVDEEGLSVRR